MTSPATFTCVVGHHIQASVACIADLYEVDRRWQLDPDNLPADESWFDRQVLRWGTVTGLERDDKWMAHFGMTRRTISYVVAMVSDVMAGKKHSSLAHIPVFKRVCCALSYLRTRCGYRTVATLFGVSETLVGLIVHQFTHAMTTPRMRMRFIDFFEVLECQPLHSISMERAGMPGAIGAIDGTYLPWIAPTTTNDFITRKGSNAILAQGVCDMTGKFRAFHVGYCGGWSDVTAYNHSCIQEKIAELQDAVGPACVLQGVPIPYYLLGDGIYPISKELMPALKGAIRPCQKSFDYRQKRTRNIIECQYGILKGRWQTLTVPSQISIEILTAIAITCVVLHNICIEEREDNSWIDTTPEDFDHEPMEAILDDGIGETVRERLIQYCHEHRHACEL